VLEEEVEDGGGDLGANGGAQIHLVALQHVLNVAGPPVCHGPEHRTKVYGTLSLAGHADPKPNCRIHERTNSLRFLGINLENH
jgi:hypothetical protein